jgi:hypothetical protein
MEQQESPEVKAFRYVESLGLNTVYDGAVQSRKGLEEKYMILNDLRNRRRTVEAFRFDCEMEVIEAERSKHPDMSQAQMDKHIKVAYSNNSDIRESNEELAMLAGQIELTEHEVDLIKTDIKIATSRLEELGGYFQFMAVLKQSETSRKSRESTTDDGNPWK